MKRHGGVTLMSAFLNYPHQVFSLDKQNKKRRGIPIHYHFNK